MKKILITGGTGLIGNHLTRLLQHQGFEVMYLSRKKKEGSFKTFYWNINTNEIDDHAVSQADYIIHLAGANVAGKRWTTGYKNEILESRIKSTALLHDSMQRSPHHIKAVISASATGYYGHRGDEWLQEDASPANDFLGNTCVQWESAVQKIASLNKRVVLLRTGIVLAKEGGALPPLVKPIGFGIAPIFGNGRQFYPWIHINDLCHMFLHAIVNENIEGPYNAVAPEPKRYIDLMSTIAKTLGKIKINVPVPMPLLKIMMGEFVETLAFSTRCSSEKIEATGFTFRYAKLKDALQELLKK